MCPVDWFYEDESEFDHLRQGDVLFSCPYIRPQAYLDVIKQRTSEDPEAEAELLVHEYDVIILSQTCDLANMKIDYVLVAPIYDIEEMLDEYYPKFNVEQRKSIRATITKGKVEGVRELGSCSYESNPWTNKFVHFNNIFTIDAASAKEIYASNRPRIRMKDLFKEYLAQEFAKYYMRIALP